MASLFIEGLDGKPINISLIQTVYLDPEDNKNVVFQFINGEIFKEELDSESGATNRLANIIEELESDEGGGSQPTGTIDIFNNGIYNVSSYANANVDVPQLDTSDANALARYIREGNTAYVNGVKITGTAEIINTIRSADITTFVRSDKYKNGQDVSHSDALYNIKLDNGLIGFISPAQSSVEGVHFDGTKVGTATKQEYLAEKIGLTADVIKSGVTILGITGTYSG